MPDLQVAPLKDRAAVVFGNGPSLGIRSWRDVADWLHGRERDLTVVLINGKAIGRSTPDYAVCVSAHQIERYREAWLHRRCGVIIPHRRRIIGAIAGLDQFVAEENVWSAPAKWPPLAVGPLAVWAMHALGHQRIYLYGLDGTVGGDGVSDAGKVGGWEEWISRYWMARRGQGLAQLIRIWPDDEPWREQRDPLRRWISRTEVACR